MEQVSGTIKVRAVVHWTDSGTGYVYIYVPRWACKQECTQFFQQYHRQYVSVYINGRRYRGRVWRYAYSYVVAIRSRFVDDFLLSLVNTEIDVELAP